MERKIKNEFNTLVEILLKTGIDLTGLPQYIGHSATDIHIKAGYPIMIYCLGMNRYTVNADIVTKERMEEIFRILCNYSVYTHVGEMRNGFITIGGKYRCGICGTAVVQNGIMATVRDITSMNIRIPRRVKGISAALAEFKGNKIDGTLIIGEPSSGKTTFLRDIADRLEDKRVVIADERYEISSLLEYSTADIMLGYDKNTAISHAVRTMSPSYIICDELDAGDIRSIELAVSTGVDLVASVHGKVTEGKRVRQLIWDLIDTGAFETIVVLEGRRFPGQINKIYGVEDFIETFRVGNGGSQRSHCCIDGDEFHEKSY